MKGVPIAAMALSPKRADIESTLRMGRKVELHAQPLENAPSLTDLLSSRRDIYVGGVSVCPSKESSTCQICFIGYVKIVYH